MAETGNESTKGSQPSEKAGLSMERRLLLAFLLMMAVLFLTPYFYKPSAPPPASKPAAQQKTQTTNAAAETSPAGSEAAPPLNVPGQVAAEKEAAYVVDTDLYKVVFSNRGGVVRSWLLKRYKDNTGKPVELVNGPGAEKTGYPFSLAFADPTPAVDLRQAL